MENTEPVMPGVIRDEQGRFVPGVSGNPKGPGPGYKKKLSRIAEGILAAYETLGGDESFAEWAKRNKNEFYKMISTLLPKETKLQLSGEEGNRIIVEFVDGNKDQSNQRPAAQS